MAGVGDKLMTASEIKTVTDTKLAKDFSSLTSIGHSLENDYLFAVQRSDKDHASKITYSALGTDILNKIGSNGIVSVAHGGTGASDGSGARTNLDVYSKSETDSAIQQSTASVGVGSLITTVSQYCDLRFAKRTGGVVIISLLVKKDTPNGAVICTFDSSIKPAENDYVSALFYGSGQLNTAASVWIESSDTSKATYYGSTATAGAYVNIVYGVK